MYLVAIDFETANQYPESACSVGIVVYDEGIEVDSYSTLIKPAKRFGHFDWRNVRIHGIQPEEVVDAPAFPEVYNWLKKYFHNSIFVAHNASFDMNVFLKNCLLYDLWVPHLRYFDTVRLTQRMFPYLEHHRLNDCCEYMGIELNHHNALSDSEGCAGIVINCMVLAQEVELESFLKSCQVEVKTLEYNSRRG